MLLISSARFDEHVTPPGHPERVERAGVFSAAAERWGAAGGPVATPRVATREQLERVHGPSYLDRVAATGGHAPAMLDADTFTSPASHEVALLAAGAAVQAAEHALAHREPAFALVRPPGHHAERDRAMGFCLYNNAAVAAAAAVAAGCERVAVVDIDVHHGNGTQWMFYDDPRVLYVSTHQHPFYPGTGAPDEIGIKEGTGFTVNVPLEAGAGDADYDLVYRSAIVPVLHEFKPELLLVSAGFDAHERDPLASMRVTTPGYAAVIAQLRNVAEAHGAFALVTEGGYDLEALAECLDAAFAILGADVAPSNAVIQAPPTGSKPDARRGERALEAVRAEHAAYWRTL